MAEQHSPASTDEHDHSPASSAQKSPARLPARLRAQTIDQMAPIPEVYHTHYNKARIQRGLEYSLSRMGSVRRPSPRTMTALSVYWGVCAKAIHGGITEELQQEIQLRSVAVSDDYITKSPARLAGNPTTTLLHHRIERWSTQATTTTS